MSITKEIYKYLDMNDDTTKIYEEDYISDGYTSDMSNLYEDIGLHDDSGIDLCDEEIVTKPLNIVSKSEATQVLEFTAQIIELFCRLTCNLRRSENDKERFTNDTNELIQLLKNTPNEEVFKKNESYSKLLTNAYIMKDNMMKVLESF